MSKPALCGPPSFFYFVDTKYHIIQYPLVYRVFTIPNILTVKQETKRFYTKGTKKILLYVTLASVVFYVLDNTSII